MKKDSKETKNSEFLFGLFQLKYNHYLHRKKVLNNKSSNLLAFTGLILTFQGALGTFLIYLLKNFNSTFKLIIILLFILPLVLYSISVYYSIKSYKINEWVYFPSSSFLMKNHELKTDKSIVIEKSLNDFPDILEDNDEVLNEKVNSLIKSVNLLQFGLFLSVIYIFVLSILLASS